MRNLVLTDLPLYVRIWVRCLIVLHPSRDQSFEGTVCAAKNKFSNTSGICALMGEGSPLWQLFLISAFRVCLILFNRNKTKTFCHHRDRKFMVLRTSKLNICDYYFHFKLSLDWYLDETVGLRAVIQNIQSACWRSCQDCSSNPKKD